MGAESPGKCPFGVPGGHPDGVVQSLSFVVQDGGTGADLAEGHFGGDGGKAMFEGGEGIFRLGNRPERCRAAVKGVLGHSLLGSGQLGVCRGELLLYGGLGRVRDHPGGVVPVLGIGVEGIKAPGAHEAEQVLLAPAGEHGDGHLGGRKIGPRGKDLGLVPTCGIEAGDLAAGEVAATAVVADPHSPVRKEVVELVAETVGHLVGRKRPVRLG